MYYWFAITSYRGFRWNHFPVAVLAGEMCDVFRFGHVSHFLMFLNVCFRVQQWLGYCAVCFYCLSRLMSMDKSLEVFIFHAISVSILIICLAVAACHGYLACIYFCEETIPKMQPKYNFSRTNSAPWFSMTGCMDVLKECSAMVDRAWMQFRLKFVYPLHELPTRGNRKL